MVNNIEKIKTFLSFEKENAIYRIMIIKRRKENPDMKKGSSTIKEYFIFSMEELNHLYPKIKNFCDAFNARAYIDLNPRDAQKVALKSISLSADYIAEGHFAPVMSAFSKAFSKTKPLSKVWVLDLDEGDEDEGTEFIQYAIAIKRKIIEVQKENTKKDSFCALLQTQNGVHIICSPFNKTKLLLEKEDIKPVTLLYIP